MPIPTIEVIKEVYITTWIFLVTSSQQILVTQTLQELQRAKNIVVPGNVMGRVSHCLGQFSEPERNPNTLSKNAIPRSSFKIQEKFLFLVSR